LIKKSEKCLVRAITYCEAILHVNLLKEVILEATEHRVKLL